MKSVMCFGTFDLLHLGHLHYFKEAKKYGDYLIVVIARDRTKQLQKKQTVFLEQERLELIQSLRIVDKAVLGNPEDHFKVVEKFKPDVICLGYDHPLSEQQLQQKLEQRDLRPKVVRISPYKPQQHKSSVLRKLVLRKK